MPKGYNPMQGGNFNMNQMMKQAQKMQKQIEDTKAELDEKTLEISAGGGAVKIVINGKKEIQELTLSPDVVDPDDVEMLQDLVMSAVNEAVRQADEMVNSRMAQITGGAGGLGGLF
ncbi:MAG: YbaB/EbfC family nucleoid-associated protein [Defluviitaleaceae bacterium]|nr:YbaB/EbfC family nucleoid-associated protein [Defluviitaleaceae bacterium]